MCLVEIVQSMMSEWGREDMYSQTGNATVFLMACNQND